MTQATGVLATLTKAALGGHDDGTSDGVAVVKTSAGQMVKVPLGLANTCLTATSGSASIAFQPAALKNSDGTGRVAQLQVPPLTAGAGGTSGAYLEQTIYGPRVGVRFQRDNSNGSVPFTFMVDGVSYAVRNTNARRQSTRQSYSDLDGLMYVVDDLGPGVHTVGVFVAADQIGGATRILNLYGFLADRAAGYEDRRHLGMMGSTGMTAMPTSVASIPISSVGGIRKLHWFNSDTASHTVTVSANNKTLKSITIAAGVHAEYDFGEPVGVASSGSSSFLNWIADSALVFYMVQESA